MISNTIFYNSKQSFCQMDDSKTLFYGLYGDIWKIAGIVLAGLCTDTQSNSFINFVKRCTVSSYIVSISNQQCVS